MHVLVVDDNVELLELVTRTLGNEGHRMSEARSVAEARAVLGMHQPDVMVLDLGLPDGSGLAFCEELRRANNNVQILVLTARSAVSDRVEGLDAGADDFLCKPFAVAELRARVRALGRRKPQRGKLLYAKDDVALDFDKRKATRAGKDVPITTREWAILSMLAQSEGTFVTHARLLEDIWGRVTDSNRASLEVLIGRIRKKLGESFIRTVRGEGYGID